MSELQVHVDDRAVRVSFDRPDRRNALDLATSRRLDQVLDEHVDTALPMVFRSATPGMFVAGTDVADLRARTLEDSLARVNARLFQRIEDHPWPTVAAVDGPALGGGCELALACDLRLTSTRARWGLPEVRLGIVPSAGGLWRLPRLIGWSAAVDLILTGRRIDGAEAARLTLAHRLVEPDAFDAALEELLDELANASRAAGRLAKEAMRAPPDQHRLVDALAQAVSLGDEDAQRRLDDLLRR